MALLTLYSENKDISWIISKNPQSGLAIREIRQGLGIGWFNKNNTEYNVYFIDGDNVDSFSNSEFEYLSQGRYISSLAYLFLINEFFSSALKKDNILDIESINSITIYSIYAKSKILETLKSYLNTIEIIVDKKINDIYKITIKSNNITLKDILYIALIVCLFLADSDATYIANCNKDFILKYSKIIYKLNLPYFLRYLFSSNFLITIDKYNDNIKYLNNDLIKIKFGNTQQQRFDFINNNLSYKYPILDIGCGEGFYISRLYFKVSKYIAIDNSDYCLDAVNDLVEKKKISNIEIYNSLDKYNKNDIIEILLTEVLEHLYENDAIDFLIEILKLKFKKLIITSPNILFNKYYLIERFRHEDHKWEKSKNDFVKFIEQCIEKSLDKNIFFEYYGVGDNCNGEFTTHGIIIYKD